MKIKYTRKEAKKKGLKFYTACRPCIKGHEPKRITSSGKCVGCYEEKRLVELEDLKHRRQERIERDRPRLYTAMFRYSDGTVQVLGPYKSIKTMAANYNRMHINVYGCESPVDLAAIYK